MTIRDQILELLGNRVFKYQKGETKGFEDNNMEIKYESELLIEVIEYKYNDFSAIYLLDNLDDLVEDIYFNVNTRLYTLAK